MTLQPEEISKNIFLDFLNKQDKNCKSYLLINKFISKKVNKNERIIKFDLIIYLLKILPYFLNLKIFFNLKQKVFNIYINKNNLTFLLNFLKRHNLLSFDTLIGITVVDYPENFYRFELNYFLLSYKLNLRIIIKVLANDYSIIPSISLIYNSAVWYEREVWDLFGIFFFGNKDLRRILTDYGFEGHPFRKDYPQTGFIEVRYDDENKLVKYEPLEMVQEHRNFDFKNPWI